MTDPPKVKTWIVCISGYLQDEGDAQGIPELHNKVHSLYEDSTTWTVFCKWNEDWRAKAEWIRRLSADNVRVIVFAYSWGVGHGLVQLAKELRRHRIYIQTAVCSDGVRYSRFPVLRNLLAYLPFISWSKIVIPNNVREVWWFIQRNTWLRGHDIVAEGRQTIHPLELDDNSGTHQNMDESKPFQDKCIEVADAAVQ